MNTTVHGLKKPGYNDYCDVQILNDNMDKLEEILATKANLTDITTPFNFKGSVTFANLPGSGNTQNDTYYVSDKHCRYTWTGSAWAQSSMDESVYEDELAAIIDRLDALGLSVVDGKLCMTYTEE